MVPKLTRRRHGCSPRGLPVARDRRYPSGPEAGQVVQEEFGQGDPAERRLMTSGVGPRSTPSIARGSSATSGGSTPGPGRPMGGVGARRVGGAGPSPSTGRLTANEGERRAAATKGTFG